MNPLIKLTAVAPLQGFKTEETLLVNPANILKVEDNPFEVLLFDVN